jgi:mycothiol synthase
VHEADAEKAVHVVLAIDAACAAADGESAVDEAARMALRHRGLEGSSLWLGDVDADMVEVPEVDTQPDAGFALLRGRSLDLAVEPSARGAGLGRQLARSALAQAPADVTAWSHSNDPAAASLAEAFGFAAVRSLWVMERAAGAVDLPEVDGVTIRGYRDADADEVLRVNAAAFAHHPEQGSMDAAELAERMAEPWFDPDGLLVADTGSPDHRLLAFHWTKQHSAELGEVYVVAVDPAAQGRGLGRAVTAAGLAHLAAGGVRRIILYVESDNEPAVATYSRLGFRHTATHVQYARR